MMPKNRSAQSNHLDRRDWLQILVPIACTIVLVAIIIGTKFEAATHASAINHPMVNNPMTQQLTIAPAILQIGTIFLGYGTAALFNFVKRWIDTRFEGYTIISPRRHKITRQPVKPA